MNGAEGIVGAHILLPLGIGKLIQQLQELQILKLIELGDDDHCVLHDTAPPKE